MKKMDIRRSHSTPYYPQCNGLVEKVNGVICKIISKQVGEKPKTWDQHLGAALWAYRTSFKTSLGFTPFHLVYGQEALLPIEVKLASLRVLERENLKPKEKIKQRILDLERLQLDREQAIVYYSSQARERKEKFDKKQAAKKIQKGSLVLRYDNRYDNVKGRKFEPRWEGPYEVVRRYANGSYRLKNITGKIHKTRVNGWRLKLYHCKVKVDLMKEQQKESQLELEA